MSFTRWATALSVLALGTTVQAQPAAPTDAAPPPAAPADVATADAIVHAAYDVISGPAGERNWQRFYSLFAPGARLIPTHRGTDSLPRLDPVTPEAFAQRGAAYFSKNAFYESEIGHRMDTFGAITQRFSAYASRRAPNDAPFARGINSFQLFNDGKRWYIVTIYWDDERSGEKIPARYLSLDDARSK
jgi:hypothetical protein